MPLTAEMLEAIMNKKKLNVEFIADNNTLDTVVSNALMIQLMITVSQIGIRVDNPDNDAIIEKEKEHDNENQK